MSNNFLNLGLRFVLEIAGLVAIGVWGWQKGDGWVRFLLAFGLPILIAVLWATFRVPGDPGDAPIAIPGFLRLLFELAVFSFAVWGLWSIHATTFSWILGIAVLVHYVTSYDRILELIK